MKTLAEKNIQAIDSINQRNKDHQQNHNQSAQFRSIEVLGFRV